MSSAVRQLMKLVTFEVDVGLEKEFKQNPDKWSVLVLIDTVDGKQYQQFIEYPKGDPQNPVRYTESEDKFRSLVRSVYSEEKINKLLGVVRNLGGLKSTSGMFDFLLTK